MEEVNPKFSEIEEVEDLTDEAPFKSVKSFLEVKFEHHASLISFCSFTVVKHLLNNDDVVRYLTAFDEAGLEGADEVVEERFKAEGNGFGDEFVDDIAEANGTEVVNRFRCCHLRDKEKQRVVYVCGNKSQIKSLFDNGMDRVPHNVPTALKKPWMEAIGVRGLSKI